MLPTGDTKPPTRQMARFVTLVAFHYLRVTVQGKLHLKLNSAFAAGRIDNTYFRRSPGSACFPREYVGSCCDVTRVTKSFKPDIDMTRESHKVFGK